MIEISVLNEANLKRKVDPQTYLRALINNDVREDGRSFEDFRNISIKPG